MCGISAIYILDKKGRVLISRHFRPDLPTNIYDVFNKKILEYDEYSMKYAFLKDRPLIKDKDNNIFYFHKHNDLNLVAISSILSSTSSRPTSKTSRKRASEITSSSSTNSWTK